MKLKDYDQLLIEHNELKITNSNTSTQYQEVNASYLLLQEENTQTNNELKELSEKYNKLLINNREFQVNFDKQNDKFDELQEIYQKFLSESNKSIFSYKIFLKDLSEKYIHLFNDRIAHEYYI